MPKVINTITLLYITLFVAGCGKEDNKIIKKSFYDKNKVKQER